jgi:ribosome-binding factor A
MKHRQLRVNELLKRELSIIVAREITFENALVTINQVNVAADLKKAHVYVSVLGENKNVLSQLEEHRVAMQTELARHVVLKYTPHFVFHLDDSIERGTRIIEILQEIEQPHDSE